MKYCEKYSLNHSIFENLNCTDAQYWFGFLLADGCITGKNTIKLNLSSKDYDHLEKFKLFLGYSGPITTHSANAYTLGVRSFSIYNNLKKIGISENKRFIATMPDALKESFHAWRGVIDGDGSIFFRPREKYPLYGIKLTGSKNVCEQFMEFAVKNGCKENIVKRYDSKKSYWYYTSLQGKKCIPFMETMYQSGTSLQRKRIKVDFILNQLKT